MDQIDLGGDTSQREAEFNTCLKQLELILNELGSKGGPGEDTAWIDGYVHRLNEVAERLHTLAVTNPEHNPSHRGYT